MALPLPEVLGSFQSLSMFAWKVDECLRLDSKWFDGCTIFAPLDHMFLGDLDCFDQSCWGVHKLNGPYRMEDLFMLSNFGTGGMQTSDGLHTLLCQINEEGEYSIWLNIKGQPRRVVRVLKGDIVCASGTIVHIVDKIMFV